MSAFVFDVYGTLIDPTGVVTKLEKIVGADRATEFSSRWRTTQISYSFRRSMMGLFAPFTQCTKDALNHTCQAMGISLSSTQKTLLIDQYLALPVFSDVITNLARLKRENHKIYAFSNGAPADLGELFSHAKIESFFEEIISVEPCQRFKPDPVVYDMLKQKLGPEAGKMVFISANPFDVQGALTADLSVIWLRRDRKMIFDPWGPQPTTVISNLNEL